ncbi:MAG: tRNA pseudouridine(38-40) synthase TruA [Arenicella sp.]
MSVAECDASRYALCVEYDGSLFSGWQTQLGQRTVQEELEKAISRVADHDVAVVTAGRTDAKVHATGQIAHFDSFAQRDLLAWHFGINRFLPSDIRVHWVNIVDQDFHARFSAIKRSYRYIIYNNNIKPCLLRSYVSYQYRSLDVDKMNVAATAFIGEKDFSSVRASGCQAKTAVREILDLRVFRQGHWVWFDVTANAFLQHMVRNIAGMLMTVGYGDQKAEWVNDVIALKDRTQAGVTAQPNGLYLTQVAYTDRYELENFPPKPIFWG